MAAYCSQKNVPVTSIILKEIIRPWTWQNQEFFTLCLVFMKNDNVDNKNVFMHDPRTIYKLSVVLWKMAKGQKEKILELCL